MAAKWSSAGNPARPTAAARRLPSQHAGSLDITKRFGGPCPARTGEAREVAMANVSTEPKSTTRTAVRRDVRVAAGAVRLDGELTLPPDARGVVLFAHGSGSSRHSPRNQAVARTIQDAGVGTL